MDIKKIAITIKWTVITTLAIAIIFQIAFINAHYDEKFNSCKADGATDQTKLCSYYACHSSENFFENQWQKTRFYFLSSEYSQVTMKGTLKTCEKKNTF